MLLRTRECNMSSSTNQYCNPLLLRNQEKMLHFSSLFRRTHTCIFLRHWGCAECNLLLHTLTLDYRNSSSYINSLWAWEVPKEFSFRSKHRLKKNRVVIVTDPTLSIHKKNRIGKRSIAGPRPQRLLQQTQTTTTGFFQSDRRWR